MHADACRCVPMRPDASRCVPIRPDSSRCVPRGGNSHRAAHRSPLICMRAPRIINHRNARTRLRLIDNIILVRMIYARYLLKSFTARCRPVRSCQAFPRLRRTIRIPRESRPQRAEPVHARNETTSPRYRRNCASSSKLSSEVSGRDRFGLGSNSIFRARTRAIFRDRYGATRTGKVDVFFTGTRKERTRYSPGSFRPNIPAIRARWSNFTSGRSFRRESGTQKGRERDRALDIPSRY